MPGTAGHNPRTSARRAERICSSRPEGTPWTDGGWNTSWRKLRARPGEAGQVRPGLTAHGLRHSVATDLRGLGKTDREIADILGQRTAHATPTYHRSTDMKRSNARVIGDLQGEDRSEEKSNLPP
ncbi:hypothetical protein MKK55_06045 [Methylobacterium sp. J-059]|uniref:hypothetical protein n=1 Tax=Methylobacterium sp. J-059 TaxID=2836643 RepID=UPI001FB94FA2|nr:hypothetical protein [Methylobacterium sp. J-059]MCJ2038521.1 hypothetical protein [Methylobacterium sp. J-059]